MHEVNDDKSFESNYDSQILNAPITNREVEGGISRLKNNKAAGPDHILGEMLKACASDIVPKLTILFNRIFQTGTFPSTWAKSIIVPIFKKDDANVPDNYRPISLTSILSKVFTHILATRLTEWAERNNLIAEEQAGFRRGYRTQDNIFTLFGSIQKYINRRKTLYVCFIDFRKAFDSVDRNCLWKCLYAYGVRDNILSVLQAMYSKVESCVRCEQGLSQYFSCRSGLKQGCLASPILFTYLINDLIMNVRRYGRHGVQLFPDHTELRTLLFADDVALVSDTTIGLQHQINILVKFTKETGLTVNMAKTKVVVFRKGGYLAKHERWTLNKQILKVENGYKYLGFIFSTKLTVNNALIDLASRAKIGVVQILRSLKRIGCSDPKVFFHLFDSKVQPILLYCAEIWGLHDTSIIEQVHLYAMRKILNVSEKTPSTKLYGELGRFPLYVNAQLRCIKYWLNLVQMNSSRYPKKVYDMLLAEHRDGRTCWVSKVEETLKKNGFVQVWQQSSANAGFIKAYKQFSSSMDTEIKKQ